MKKTTFAHMLLVSAAALFLTGCYGKNYAPAEVLQLPLKSRVYTSYTLWDPSPETMTSDNIQKGKIIPFGTEVTILSLTDREFKFKAEGRTLTLRLDHARMVVRTEDFARRLFSTKNAVETAAGINPVNYEKLRRGIVGKGMTKQEVLIACGYPSPLRTPSLENETWIYLLDKVKSKRVIFKNGYVIDVVTLD